jgi:hypothetical protein
MLVMFGNQLAPVKWPAHRTLDEGQPSVRVRMKVDLDGRTQQCWAVN